MRRRNEETLTTDPCPCANFDYVRPAKPNSVIYENLRLNSKLSSSFDSTSTIDAGVFVYFHAAM